MIDLRLLNFFPLSRKFCVATRWRSVKFVEVIGAPPLYGSRSSGVVTTRPIRNQPPRNEKSEDLFLYVTKHLNFH